MTYNFRLKELREEPINFIRQKEIAKILGVHVSVYSKFENNIAIIPLNHLNTICNYYNVSLDYILGLTKKRQYENHKEQIDFETFMVRFKNLRKEEKLTQEKISSILKIEQSTISKYEKGTRKVSTQYLFAICNKFNISADYLLGKIDSKETFIS